MADDHLVIVVLNYNGADDTLRCIQSIHESYDETYTLFVVDNGSTDGSVERFQGLKPNEHLIRNERNLGFAGGMNRGIVAALRNNAKYVLLLNNDLIVKPGVIEELVEFIDANSDVAACGPRVNLLSNPDKAQFDRYEGKTKAFEDPSLSGCAILLRASTLPAIGLFDETFFIYWEETDYWQRIHHKGYKVCYVPTRAVLLHEIGGYMNRHPAQSWYYLLRNRFLYWRRWERTVRVLPRVLASPIIQLLSTPEYAGVLFRALFDGIRLALKNPKPSYSRVRLDGQSR